MVSECRRVLPTGRIFAIVIGTRISDGDLKHVPADLIQRMPDLGFTLRKEIICLKPKGTQGLWKTSAASLARWPPPTDSMGIATGRALPRYIREHGRVKVDLPERIREPRRTLVYAPRVTTFRSDPYAGNLAALDYHEYRKGLTPRHRHKDLVVHLPRVPIAAAARKFEGYRERQCPFRPGGYSLADRYLTLHLRDGCRYTKQRELRVCCYLADTDIFQDAALL